MKAILTGMLVGLLTKSLDLFRKADSLFSDMVMVSIDIHISYVDKGLAVHYSKMIQGIGNFFLS